MCIGYCILSNRWFNLLTQQAHYSIDECPYSLAAPTAAWRSVVETPHLGLLADRLQVVPKEGLHNLA